MLKPKLRNTWLDRIIDGPLGLPLINLAYLGFGLLLILLSPLTIAISAAKRVFAAIRDLRAVLANVDAGGDVNDRE